MVICYSIHSKLIHQALPGEARACWGEAVVQEGGRRGSFAAGRARSETALGGRRGWAWSAQPVTSPLASQAVLASGRLSTRGYMPHWARKGSPCSQAPGKGGVVAKKAGARGGSSVSPWGCRGHSSGGGGQQGLARCPVTQGPLPARSALPLSCGTRSTPFLSSFSLSTPGLP